MSDEDLSKFRSKLFIVWILGRLSYWFYMWTDSWVSLIFSTLRHWWISVSTALIHEHKQKMKLLFTQQNWISLRWIGLTSFSFSECEIMRNSGFEDFLSLILILRDLRNALKLWLKLHQKSSKISQIDQIPKLTFTFLSRRGEIRITELCNRKHGSS
jgi:hypothetical protein